MNETIPAGEHIAIEPKILYYGMPVILATTLNEDGTTNISPLSSSWALGHFLVLGIGTGGKALDNLRLTPELVINLPDGSLWSQVERLALLTGKFPVPASKPPDCRYAKDKFAAAGLNPQPSETVRPARILECPLQIECEVRRITVPDYAPFMAVVETEARRIHARPDLVRGGSHIDPAKWHPLIYNFRHYFSLGSEVGKSSRSET
jgi:flavin reductase (DIM6/NTAB) family NADH-FMN oxidoreductase RutF